MRWKALKWLVQNDAPLACGGAPTRTCRGGWDRGSRTARARASSATSRACSGCRATASAACASHGGDGHPLRRDALRHPAAATHRTRARGGRRPHAHPRGGGHPASAARAEGLRGVEPALAHATVAFAGGLHLPADETGDCQLFTQALAEHASKRGVRFRFETTVEALQRRGRVHDRRRDERRVAERRPLRRRARLRRGLPARAARHPPPDPAGEGLLGHAPGRARRPRAARR